MPPSISRTSPSIKLPGEMVELAEHILETTAPTKVVNLMDALHRSVEAERPTAAQAKAADRKKPAKEPERRSVKGARKAG